MHCALAIISGHFLGVENSENCCWSLKSVCIAYATTIALFFNRCWFRYIIYWGTLFSVSLSIFLKCLPLIRQSRMWSDDRWRIRREEDRVYRVRSARLGCDHQCFCYGIFVMWICWIFTSFSYGRDISAYEVSWVFYETFTGLSNTIVPSCVSNFSILFKLHFSIWLVEFWRQMNLEMFFAAWTRCWALHRRWFQSEVLKEKLFSTKCYSNATAKEKHIDLYSRSTFDPKI